jgi:hypothetical protein
MLVTQTVANLLFEIYKITILWALQSSITLYIAKFNMYSLYCWLQEQFINKLLIINQYREREGNRHLGLKIGFVIASIYIAIAATIMALAFPPRAVILNQEIQSFINSTGNGLPMLTYLDLRNVDVSKPNWIETALCNRLADCNNYNNQSIANPVSFPTTKGEIKPFNIMPAFHLNNNTIPGWSFSSFNYMCNDTASRNGLFPGGGGNCVYITYNDQDSWIANISTTYGNTNISTFYTANYSVPYDSALAIMLTFFSYNDGRNYTTQLFGIDNTDLLLASSFIKQKNLAAAGTYALKQDAVEMHRPKNLGALDIIMVQEEFIAYEANITNFSTGELSVSGNDIITNPMKCKYAYDDYLKAYKTLNATTSADSLHRLSGYLMTFSYSQITRFNDDNTITIGGCGFTATVFGTVIVLSDFANVTWIHHVEPVNLQLLNIRQDDVAIVPVIASNGEPDGKPGDVKLTTPLYLNTAINASNLNAESNIYDAVYRNYGHINATIFMNLTEYLPNVIQSGQINITAYINTVGIRVNIPWEFILLPASFLVITLITNIFVRFNRNLKQYRTTVLNTIASATGGIRIGLNANPTTIYINGNPTHTTLTPTHHNP